VTEGVLGSVGAVDQQVEQRVTFEDLSDAGRRVYLMFMKTEADVQSLGDDLFQDGRRTAEEALLQEAHAVGCSTLSVHLTTGPLLSFVRERADWAASSICDTYNRDLINAIWGIIQDVPTANRWVIAYRLRAWEAARQGWKKPQIENTESFIIANEAKLLFYEYNKVTEPDAWFGYSLICAVCQDIAAKNPYTLAEAERIGLPHIGCKDQWHIKPGEMVSCDELWLGE
jgi:hypothetical protein